MKIDAVTANNRARQFEVAAAGQRLNFPYSKASPAPTSDDRLINVFVDPELGREAFTYELESGAEGSVHLDAVLEFNEDPSYMADLALYRLSQEAQSRVAISSMSVRQLALALGTSATQLYRLLDPENKRKSVRQLITLLYFLGSEVDFAIRDRQSATQEEKTSIKRATGATKVGKPRRQAGQRRSTLILVEPRPDGRWARQKDGATRAASIHATKADALRAARTQAKREGAELVVKGRDGRIAQRDSFVKKHVVPTRTSRRQPKPHRVG